MYHGSEKHSRMRYEENYISFVLSESWVTEKTGVHSI